MNIPPLNCLSEKLPQAYQAVAADADSEETPRYPDGDPRQYYPAGTSSDDVEEILRPAHHTHPVVKDAILKWLTNCQMTSRSTPRSYLHSAVSRRWNEWIRQGIIDWQSLENAISDVGKIFLDSPYDAGFIFHSLRAQISVALKASKQWKSIMRSYAGNEEGKNRDGSPHFSREQCDEILEWLMKGQMKEVAFQLAHREDRSVTRDSQEVTELYDKFVHWWDEPEAGELTSVYRGPRNK